MVLIGFGSITIPPLIGPISSSALQQWNKHPNIMLMGADRPAYWDEDRLTITAFNIAATHPTNANVKSMCPVYPQHETFRGAHDDGASYGIRWMSGIKYADCTSLIS